MISPFPLVMGSLIDLYHLRICLQWLNRLNKLWITNKYIFYFLQLFVVAMLFWITLFLFFMTLNIVISDRYHSNSIEILSGHSNIKKPTGCTGYLCGRGVLTQTLPISPSLSSVSKSHCLAAELFSSVDDLGSNFRTSHSVLPSVVSIRLAENSHISHIISNGHVSLLCCTSLFCFFHQFSFNHILSLSFILSVSVTLLPSLPLWLLFTQTDKAEEWFG